MHPAVVDFVSSVLHQFPPSGWNVLDVGSYNVNGSNREIFNKYRNEGPWTGLDWRAGPGVDVVSLSWELPFPANTFDCVVCTETLEHDPHPERTVFEIRRVLKPNGILILTAAGPGRPAHEMECTPEAGHYGPISPAWLIDHLWGLDALYIEQIGLDVRAAGFKPAPVESRNNALVADLERSISVALTPLKSRLIALLKHGEPILYIGPASEKIAGTVSLGRGYPADLDWSLENHFPFPDNSVGGIHAYGGLAHASPLALHFIMFEAKRCLRLKDSLYIKLPATSNALFVQACIEADQFLKNQRKGSNDGWLYAEYTKEKP